MLVLYSVGLIPAVQKLLSALETHVFFAMNKLLGRNPVWDWTILLTASDFWIALTNVCSFLILIYYGWKKRTDDYGRIFGHLVFILLVVIITEETADVIADNLHRVLPWKAGVADEIKASFHADFFKMHRDEGIVDDATSSLSCLFFLAFIRAPRPALMILLMISMYVLSGIIAGTQWVTVQFSSWLMGSFFAGLALTYSAGIRRWLEHKSSDLFITSMSHIFFENKLRGFSEPKTRAPFIRQVTAKFRQLKINTKRSFWEKTIMPKALEVLNANPASAKLYTSPRLTMEKVKSDKRIRFLDADGKLFAVRAVRYRGGIYRTSPRYLHFITSVKNNLFLERLGFPVARVFWTQEGITNFGFRNYFFAIEEYLTLRPLNPALAQEIDHSMELLAQLHAHTSEYCGEINAHHTRSYYLLRYLRGDINYYLKKIARTGHLEFSSGDFDIIWKLFEVEAIAVLNDTNLRFRLIHGDVSPNNFCAGKDSSIYMVDFLTLQYDLAGHEIIKACVSLTRLFPEHCHHAWIAYFRHAGSERWKEFLLQSRLAFARFALRELAHQRVALEIGDTDVKTQIQNWIKNLFHLGDSIWGQNPNETDWKKIFKILGIHQKNREEDRKVVN